MTDSAVEPLVPQNNAVRAVWSRNLTGPVAGLSLARERGRLLAWDRDNWIHLLDDEGNAHAQHRLADLSAAGAADDGSAYAVAAGVRVSWLAPDMMARWEKSLARDVLAVALDSHGQYLAASDNHGGVQIFDRAGQTVCSVRMPRPLCHLTFVPAAPCLVGCADFGLVAGFNLAGDTLWENRPMARVGGMSVDGEGKQILLASFSDGIGRFDERGKKTSSLQIGEACRLAVQSFSGERILAAGLSKRLFLLDRQGEMLADYLLQKTPTALALGPLGDYGFAGLENGIVVKMTVKN